jgi:hypothetical protein
MRLLGPVSRSPRLGKVILPPIPVQSSVWLVTGDGQNKYVGRVVSLSADGVVFDSTRQQSSLMPGEPVTLLFSKPINEESTPRTVYAVIESIVIRSLGTETGRQIGIRFRAPDD